MKKIAIILFLSFSAIKGAEDVQAQYKSEAARLNQLVTKFSELHTDKEYPALECAFTQDPETPHTLAPVELNGVDMQVRFKKNGKTKVIVSPGARDMDAPNEDITGNDTFDIFNAHQSELAEHSKTFVRGVLYKRIRKEINSKSDSIDKEAIRELKDELFATRDQALLPLIFFCRDILAGQPLNLREKEIEFCKQYLNPCLKLIAQFSTADHSQ